MASSAFDLAFNLFQPLSFCVARNDGCRDERHDARQQILKQLSWQWDIHNNKFTSVYSRNTHFTLLQ